MSRVLLVLIVCLALVGGWLWFSAPERGPRTAQPVEAAAVQPAPPAADVAPVSAPALEPLATPTPTSAPATREAAAGTLEAELAAAQWVAGHVTFPPGTPLDEEAFVVADGKEFADGEDQRARVAADGSFRVAFSAESRSGWLRLDARYLHLDEAVRWKRGAAAEPVLEPKLGARIEGRVTLPAGADAATAVGTVQLQLLDDDPDSWESGEARPVAADLGFAFDALATRGSVRVYYDGAAFIGRSEALKLRPGETTSVVLELQAGVVLAGVVHDASGAALAGVEVYANVQARELPWTLDHGRSTTTGADGRFRLGAMAAGEVQLQAKLDGFRPVTRKLGAEALGTQRTDLVLVLDRGLSLAGSVRWPDGTPAEATLELTPRKTQKGWDPSEPDVQGHSDASGHFEVTGLGNHAYRLKAQAVKREEVLVKSELTGKERKKTQRSQWSAEASDVAVGTHDLVLTLSTGLALAGRVVDDLGQALADFRVRGELVPDGQRFEGDDDDVARSFRDTDGTFTLEGFAPGAWDIVAEAKGHAPSEPVRVTLPTAASIALVAPREAVVSGIVLDASGTPVEDARAFAQRGEQRSKRFEEYGGGDRTDAHGAFRLAGLSPGSVRLRAEGSAGAPSAPLELELVAGQTLDNLVLRLEPATLLTGEVVSAGGRPLVGVTVWAYSEQRFSENRETDAQGRFEFANMPAGDLHVSAKTPEGLQLSAQVTVVAGASAHVRLSPPDQLVHLTGRVQAGGQPLAEASLYASALEGDKTRMFTGSSAETDADGRYELELPGPGGYYLHVNSWQEQQVSWSAALDVPAVESFAYDIAIPLGRISGRVRDSSGNALANIDVRSEPERHDGAAGSGSATTDEDGSYEMLVPAGRHAVHAGGGKRRSDVEARYAEARVGGLVLAEGAHLGGIDLVLVAGGTLEGSVRNADGTAASRAQLMTEQDGRTRYLGNCDESGAFHLEGLTPGPLLVRALNANAATREAVRVEIVAGETRRVELELVPAVWVHLKVRDTSGTLLGSELTAVDANGRRQPIQTGPQAGDAWLGPLPPGHYTVRAQRDVKTVERELDVAGGEERMELELVFE